MRPTRPTTVLTFVLLAILAVPALAPAQSGADFDFYADGPYRDGVPTPESMFGYAVGELHTTYGRMEQYFAALAEAAPDRIHLEQYGWSVEKRRLWVAAISSEANIARLDEIRQDNLRLVDPRTTGEEDAQRIVAGNPIIVWLNYANDGNETAAFEAAIRAAYQLVAGESAETQRFREEALVIITPAHNPESHERFVAWYNAFAMGDADPLALEHNAPWGMDTNNNHFQIDLNRDAWPIVQQETRAIAALLLRWRPQVFVDHHGQPDVYFFPPPAIPVNASLPEQTVRWLETFGRGNARAFDEHGWNYMVRENYDLFYPGYWDSWPTMHGATGMTYEVDGGGRKGLAWRRDDDTVITFRQAIAHHFTASMATVRTAVENREARLADFHEFFVSAVQEGRTGAVRSFVFTPGDNPRRAAALAATMMRHGVEVQRTSAAVEAQGTDYLTGETARRELPAGTYVIDLAQPDKRIAETMMAREAPLDPEFVDEQLARFGRNARRGSDEPREGYQFYDVTSWSLPFAFGTDAMALPDLPEVQLSPLAMTAVAAGGNDWADEIPFAVDELDPGARHAVNGDEPTPAAGARTAYLFEPYADGALRLVAGLMKEGFNVSVAQRSIVAASQDFPIGTFIVFTNRNSDALHQRIGPLARDAGVEVYALNTAFNAYGGRGVGSRAVASLRAPRIAMLAGEGVNATGYGAAWYAIAERLNYPFTALRAAQLLQGDLRDFDVIIVPDLRGGDLRRGLGDDGLDKLRRWTRDGGTLVTWGSGTVFAAANDLASVEFVGAEQDTGVQNAAADTAGDERIAAAGALAESQEPSPPAVSPAADPDVPEPVPGAVFKARLDLGHWLTFGYDDVTLPVLVRGADFMRLSPAGANVAVFVDEPGLLLSGFAWPGNTERLLAGTAYVIAEGRGRGQVILLGGDPNFRLAWRSTGRMFGNAVLLGGTLR
ncbi:MAG: M14 family metallopeptidase [Acidobacteriota bacterium]|jgi:hypothetical protein